MNKEQLERLMGLLATMEGVINEDPDGSMAVKEKFLPLQMKVAEELKNIIWNEYVTKQAAKEA